MAGFSTLRYKPFLEAGLLAAALAMGACSRLETIEEHYADGLPKSRSTYMHMSDDALLPNGVQLTWYPDGVKESMTTYVNGYRQGYAFRWHADGRVQSLEHYTNGLRDGHVLHWDDAGNLLACLNAEEGFNGEKDGCKRLSQAENAQLARIASIP